MDREVLIVSMTDGAESCARAIASQVGAQVEVAANRRLGLAMLRRRSYDVVVVEESMAEADPDWADQVWELAGLAMPVQVNFAIAGCARLAREVKAALQRRQGTQAVAMRAAVTAVENDLKSTVTGLLLESELALREPEIPPSLEPKLRLLVELAGVLKQRLSSATEARG
jgi:hypothetical protein